MKYLITWFLFGLKYSGSLITNDVYGMLPLVLPWYKRIFYRVQVTPFLNEQAEEGCMQEEGCCMVLHEDGE